MSNDQEYIEEDTDIYFTLQESELCSIGDVLYNITINEENDYGYFTATQVNNKKSTLSFSKKQVYNGDLHNGVLKLKSSYENVNYIIFYKLERFTR